MHLVGESLLGNDTGDSPGWMTLTGVSRVGFADDVCGESADSRDAGRICGTEEGHGW